jgi:hypothetical protein
MIYIYNIITEEKVDTDQREKCDTDRDSVVSEQSLEGGCISLITSIGLGIFPSTI